MLKIDYFSKVPPGEGTKFIVQKHSKVIIETLLKDINDFSLKTNLKEKCLSQLYALIVCIEGEGIKPFTEKILKSIVYKLILEDGSSANSSIVPGES